MKNMKKDLDLDSLIKKLEEMTPPVDNSNTVEKIQQELKRQINSLNNILKITKEKNTGDWSNSYDDGL